MAVTATGYAVNTRNDLAMISDLPLTTEFGFYKIFVYSEGREYIYIPDSFAVGTIASTRVTAISGAADGSLGKQEIFNTANYVIPYINLDKKRAGYWKACYSLMLQANRTIYVDQLRGDDAKGTGVSTISAYASIQRALREASAWDCNGFDVTVQLADGYHNIKTPIDVPELYRVGTATIQGNVSNNQLVQIDSTLGSFIHAGIGGTSSRWKISSMTINGTNASNYWMIMATGNAILNPHNLRFNTGVIALFSVAGGKIEVTGGLAIQGSWSTSWLFANEKGLLICRNQTITMVSTPAFSFAGVYSGLGSVIIADALTFSGSATGVRYSSRENSVIYTNGGGASYFPGNSAGTTLTGGLYV